MVCNCYQCATHARQLEHFREVGKRLIRYTEHLDTCHYTCTCGLTALLIELGVD